MKQNNLKHIITYIPPTISSIIIKPEFNISEVYSLTAVVLRIKIKNIISVLLSLNNQDFDQKEKTYSEYLSISISRLIFQISAIITQNNGEILKMSDDSIIALWEYDSENSNAMLFHCLQCGFNLLRKINHQEIAKGVKIQMCSYVGIGKCSISFLKGVDSISYIIYGDGIDQTFNEYDCTGDIVLSKSVYEKVENHLTEDIITKEKDTYVIKNESILKIHKVSNISRVSLNVSSTKLLKFKKNLSYFDNNYFGKLSQKIDILASLVPKLAMLYIDSQIEKASQEVRMLTFVYLKICQRVSLSNIKAMSELYVRLSKCVKLTSGTIHQVASETDGMVIKIAWGIPPNSFVDDPARAVSTSFLIKGLCDELGFDIKIGVSSGSCFISINGVQGNRKALNVIGSTLIQCKVLMEESNNQIFIDKKTMKMTRKFFRSGRVKQIILHDTNLIDNGEKGENPEDSQEKSIIPDIFLDVFTPFFDEGDFPLLKSDPFPFIHTHKYNSYNPKTFIQEKSEPAQNDDQLITTIPTSPTSPMSENDLKTSRLKRSQTIFGNSSQVEDFVSLINDCYLNKGKETILVQGYLGTGKSLFIRKGLNNFIGMNNELSELYFKSPPFVFCTNRNPLTELFPYNGIAKIIAKMIKLISVTMKKEIINLIYRVQLSEKTLYDIQFILSSSTPDFDLFQLLKITINSKSISRKFSYLNLISITNFVPNDKDKINLFFCHIINLYRIFLKNNLEIAPPLILIMEDVQKFDVYSLQLLSLMEKKDLKSDPFIIILSYQIPLHPLLSKEIDLISFGLTELNTFTISPLRAKKDLEKLIIFCFQDLVMKRFKTSLERVDEKILDFVLEKSFHGVPLFVIQLMECLIKTETFIQTLSSEFIITSELLDNNEIFEWSAICIPPAYEKIYGEFIDKTLDPDEVIILKHASIIGTFFDIKTLDEINPLQDINVNYIYDFLSELEIHGLVDLYSGFDFKIKKFVCVFTLPFFRECLYQRIPLQTRSQLHLAIAKIMESSKVKYFPVEKEYKMFKRHLMKSEMSINSEVESRKVKTIEDIINSKEVLNINNLKIILVKNICVHLSGEGSISILEGSLSMKSNLWEKKYLMLNQRFLSIYCSQADVEEKKVIDKVPLGDIFNIEVMSDDNVMAVYVARFVKEGDKGEKLMFKGDKREEIFKWAISLNFLRVKAAYNEFAQKYDRIKFPLFRYKKNVKEKRVFRLTKENVVQIAKPYTNNEEKLRDIEKYYHPVRTAFSAGFGVFIAMLMSKTINGNNEDSQLINDDDHNDNYTEFINTPSFIEDSVEDFIKHREEEEAKKKAEREKKKKRELEEEREYEEEKRRKEEEERKKEEEEAKAKEEKKNSPLFTSSMANIDIEPISKKESNSDTESDSFNISAQKEDEDNMQKNMKNIHKEIPKKKKIFDSPNRPHTPDDFIPRKKYKRNKNHQYYYSRGGEDELEKVNVCKFSSQKDKELFNLNNQVKEKCFFDDPKYKYIEKEEKHKKVHKSTLFKTLKKQINK